MSDVWGGGLVVAAAATLWLVYLIPTWLRRREYLATERNAVRLQQTLRILAETAEVPQQVRLEATARTVAKQQHLLRQIEAREEAEAALEATESEAATREAVAKAEAAAAALAAESAARLPVVSKPAVQKVSSGRMPQTESGAVRGARRGRRRARAVTSLVLLLSLIAAGLGVFFAVTGGGWLVLGGAGIIAVASVTVLARLAHRKAPAATASAEIRRPVAPALYDQGSSVADEEPSAQTTWTPRPLPKPLYLSRGTAAASAMASVDAAADLRRAAAQSEVALRAAQLAPEVTPIRVPVIIPSAEPGRASGRAVPAEAPSRFASMGIIADTEQGAIDLDAALRRRRAAS